VLALAAGSLGLGLGALLLQRRGWPGGEEGQALRQFALTAATTVLPLNPAVRFKAWAVNGRVPGPTLRCTVGDRLRILFRNQDSTSHSLHFHGIHPAAMDGIRPIRHGRSSS
jgi:FtsP/CotA-like multicopper oxidase with cupredoxin domain